MVKVPARPPPRTLCGEPTVDYLSAGTILWRVHHANLRPAQFAVSTADSPWSGGRFDSTRADPFPFLYASREPETAFCETLLRSLPVGHGVRHLQRARLRNRLVSSLTVTRNLGVLSLAETQHLLSVCQDDWLVHAEGLEYTGTRDWASWLRRHVLDAQGFVWCSARDVPKHSLVFFGDRCPPGSIELGPKPPLLLDSPDGIDFLNQCLAAYRVTIGR